MARSFLQKKPTFMGSVPLLNPYVGLSDGDFKAFARGVITKSQFVKTVTRASSLQESKMGRKHIAPLA
jgi:hypothetical protein